MQKKRSRKNGTASADGPANAGRRVRVRSRLVVGVAVAGLTVLAAGAPAVVSATRELNDSQRLVTLAEQTRHALTLGHLLGDERDAVVEYVAKGRPGNAKAPVDERTTRTDRQITELKPEADAELARALGKVKAVRAEAVDGKGSALAAHQAYAGLIAELLAPGDRLAELTPPRAEAALAVTRPMAPLGQAVDQASATRGLLLAALAVPRGEQPPNSALADELSGAAQRSRVREQAALDDFTRAARPDVRQTLAATVTGPEVKAADDHLKRLTERPTLTPAERRATDAGAVGTALTARIDRMRSVESTLAGQRATALATLRDDDVTRLELMAAALGVLFLFVVGFSTAIARSLTRPLSVLRRGAERLATPEGSQEPVRFTGRNDEFAQVVGHLNAVRDQTVALHTRIAGLDADRRRLIGRNEALSTGREALEQELAQLRAGLEEHRRIMSTTSVSLSLRTLGLVERQLVVIEELESKEGDPDRLATLFKLDHLATVMRRHNENLLVLAGQEHGHGQSLPVPLIDVMRAAVSEIERYERVDLTALPSYTQVAGHAADDISHVLAELLENATTFSPPDAKVKVSGRLEDSGAVVLSVVDAGIGVTEDRLASLNARLSTPDAYDEEPEAEHGLGLGLYVAGRLAARHGVSAELRAGRHGGTEALVVVPAALLPAGPVQTPASPVHTLATPGAPAFQLPGVVAEANENTLPPRLRVPAPQPDPQPESGVEPGVEPAAVEVVTLAEAFDAEATEAEAEAFDAGAAGADGSTGSDGSTGFEGSAEADDLESESEAYDSEPFDAGSLVAEAFGPGAFTKPAPAAAASEDAQLPPAEQIFTASAPEPATAEAEPAKVVTLAEAFDPEAADAAADAGAVPDDSDDSGHRRAADAEDGFVPRQGSHPEPMAEPATEPVTAKGLPKRTPRSVAAPATGNPAAARPEPRRVDAEELRRRLGGFYQGAQDGRRVVAAELAQDRQGRQDRHDPQDPQGPPDRGQGHTDQGDTAQEART
ncbi:nitrate- and nitrite sensing domain-containing protein [Streptomyces sp. NBC_00091]|uniref:nitrate- and nitrite sensing domain-containing protein n=1 Tax=Streptomyces sp. NBC_00091 TaxID=2975648 RepID=UPI00225A0E86|nr:nitrate- and nitrite sensing domain-containing protein [Streptomyces sp. NBC_00091]MCX5375894.1 nitrate- and nitrite sensing domain-containing protein [Streptomyces sp. NBC_00091]